MEPIDGLIVAGKRATTILPLPPSVQFSQRVNARLMSIDEFIAQCGSGTLRKAKAIGMNVQSHALYERVAYEFGYYFQACPERFVTWGEPRSEPDSKAITEVGWHVERYARVCLFPGDQIECKYIIVERDGVREEGIGIVVRATSAPWVPIGYIVFCIVAVYDPKTHDFLPARNPC
jgi:hypothetical protein